MKKERTILRQAIQRLIQESNKFHELAKSSALKGALATEDGIITSDGYKAFRLARSHALRADTLKHAAAIVDGRSA